MVSVVHMVKINCDNFGILPIGLYDLEVDVQQLVFISIEVSPHWNKRSFI
jgi:hypothetical protein